MILNKIYSQNLFSLLFTDHYHLTTSQIYFLNNKHEEQAVFYSYIRNNYPDNNYTVFSGIFLILEFIKTLNQNPINASQTEYLKKLGFDEKFCDFLSSMNFLDIKIYSLKNGDIFFPQQPILRIEGPIIKCKILESVILNILNSHCGYATHADRIKFATSFEWENGTPIGISSVQGLRRGSSLGSSLESSLTLTNHGYNSTSTVLQAYFSNLKSVGTMDHCWIMSHETELEAFEIYAKHNPNNGVFLVDTFNIKQGIENAIIVLNELRKNNCGENYGLRIDSGDVIKWSFYALRRFFEEGLIFNNYTNKEVESFSDFELLKLASKIKHSLFCCASDSLNENKILQMRKDGCFIKFWGIGTGGSHLPPLGIVYKISQLNKKPLAKLSGENYSKSSLPGTLNSCYLLNNNDEIIGVIIYDEKLGISTQAIDYQTKQIENLSNYQLSFFILHKFDIFSNSSESNNIQFNEDRISCSMMNFFIKQNSVTLIEENLWKNFNYYVSKLHNNTVE